MPQSNKNLIVAGGPKGASLSEDGYKVAHSTNDSLIVKPGWGLSKHHVELGSLKPAAPLEVIQEDSYLKGRE
jgi:hypothetical protein